MSRRTWLAAALGASLTLGNVLPGTALAAPALQEVSGDRFTANGTIIALHSDSQAEFRTSDLSGQPETITLDLSWLTDEDRDYAYFGERTPIAALLQPLDDGTYRAVQFEQLSQGSMVNNTDWGVQEEYTTRDDSINARTDNGPDDDEARAQGTDDEDDD
ncbi:MAG: hypothetical protein AB7P40_15095 [Chloroflexota bacterium]